MKEFGVAHFVRAGLATIIVMGVFATAGMAWADYENSTEWPTYGHDTGGMRFSPLTQITPENVARLKQAWVYHMRPLGFQRYLQSQSTPLVIDGLLYVTTPYNRVVALDSSTGREVWSYDIPNNANASTRGAEYWPGDATTPPQIIFAVADGRNGGDYVVSVDAKTGKPNAKFGRNGILGAPPGTPPLAGPPATSPPIIYKNILISGVLNPNRDGRPGDVRGFDIRTGQQLWRFDTIPKKGELGYDTWAPGSVEKQTTGSHVWGLMTVDSERGIVYFPTDAAHWDRYGADRHGANLFSSSLVALDANTGKRLWHFQAVHHDIWDFDLQAPPTLFDVHKDGQTIPAVALQTKSALIFTFNRITGEPIFGVEERPVPASEAPGEQAWPTQPFPVKPDPVGRQTMSMADIAKVTPELTKFCTDMVEQNKIGLGGPYMPPGFDHPTINFPGPNGSTNWGGASFSPQLGYLFINSQDLGQMTRLGPRGEPLQANGVTGTMGLENPNIAYTMVGLNGRFMQVDSKLLCQEPPWGRLTAVNMNTGEFAWQVPLGVSDNLPADRQKTGRPNSGGSIVTAGGVLFIGATDDGRFRAFNARTGAEIWTIKLPAPSHSVPVTYLGKNGKQFVVFPSTGGNILTPGASDDSLFAYALP